MVCFNSLIFPASHAIHCQAARQALGKKLRMLAEIERAANIPPGELVAGLLDIIAGAEFLDVVDYIENVHPDIIRAPDWREQVAEALTNL